MFGGYPLNFGHSDFHELRAKEIEKREAGFYIGDLDAVKHILV